MASLVAGGMLRGACSAAVTPPSRAARPELVQAARPSVASSIGWHATRRGAHYLYGTIVALRGSVITLKLRNERVQVVDAAVALAQGAYSAPLFVGKVVCIDGNLQNGTLVAAHITRLHDLNRLPNDH